VHGFFQEQAALQRILDEFREDIMFLSLGVCRQEMTNLHRQYLDAFYEEELDNDDPLKATQRRPTIPRKRIRAYLSRIEGPTPDQGTRIEVSRTLSKAYSGFVHGASPHIMEMYGGNPPRFHVTGMLGTPREDEYRRDLLHYFYRGILALGFAALAFGDRGSFNHIQQYRDEFYRRSGMHSAHSADRTRASSRVTGRGASSCRRFAPQLTSGGY
jgi:hypothetical protein